MNAAASTAKKTTKKAVSKKETSTDDAAGQEDGSPTEADLENASEATAAEQDAVIINLDGSVSGDLYDPESAEEYVKITREVLEEFYYPGTKRPAFRVLFVPGQVVPKSRIDAINARNSDSTPAELEAAGDGGARLATSYTGLSSLEEK